MKWVNKLEGLGRMIPMHTKKGNTISYQGKGLHTKCENNKHVYIGPNTKNLEYVALHNTIRNLGCQ